MSAPVFANALRTHSRLRVLTATRVVLPTTRNISSLVTFRTAVPKNASFSVSRSFTTSQIARNELKDGSRDTPKDASGSTIFVWNIPRRATEEDLAQVLSEFGRVTDVRLRAFFFFPDRSFSTGFFLRTTLLDMYQSGRHRGTAHVDFASNDGAVAIKELADRKPIEILDRRLLIKIAHCKPRIHEPNEKLYVKGCAGDESEIRDIFQQFSDSIVKISLCMLSTLSDLFIPTTHMEQH